MEGCAVISQAIFFAVHQDCEECVNDTWLSAWNRIPPEKPQRLSAYVGRIARNLALKRYAYLSAEKRCEEAVCSLTELEDCISGRDSVEDELECRRIESAISDFLWRQEDWRVRFSYAVTGIRFDR